MTRKHPKSGSIRVRSGFLLLPKRIGRITKWLTRAAWREQYIEASNIGWWQATEWIDQLGKTAYFQEQEECSTPR